MSIEKPLVRAIIFDLDGTLIDSAPDIHAAANRLMGELSLPAFDLKTIVSFVGNGIPKLVERCLAASGEAGRTVDLDHAIERFKAYYAEEPTLRTRPYPGVIEALAEFSGAGCRLGIVTNKAEELSHAALAGLGLAHFFQVVVGGDTLATRKPDPEGLALALAKLGASKADSLYVGDSEVDAETAACAGVRFALFTDGYRKSPISALPHWYAFDDMRMLLKHVTLIDAAETRPLELR